MDKTHLGQVEISLDGLKKGAQIGLPKSYIFSYAFEMGCRCHKERFSSYLGHHHKSQLACMYVVSLQVRVYQNVILHKALSCKNE